MSQDPQSIAEMLSKVSDDLDHLLSEYRCLRRVVASINHSNATCELISAALNALHVCPERPKELSNG